MKDYTITNMKSTRFDKIKYCPNCGAKMVEPQERRDKECYTQVKRYMTH